MASPNKSSTVLSARFRVMKNDIIVNDRGVEFIARPLGWDIEGIIGMLQRAFTLRYFLYKDNTLISELRYDDIKDGFEITKDGVTTIINPEGFTIGDRKYKLETSLTDMRVVDISEGSSKAVASAKCSVARYSVVFKEYPEHLKDIIKEITVLYIIRKIVWSMINPI